MDILKMLNDLKAERDRIGEAITVLERLAIGGKKRRGRPPNWMKKKEPIQITAPVRMRHGKRSMETRRRMSIAQKKRWANA